MKKRNLGFAVLTAAAVLTLGSAFNAFAGDWKNDGTEWTYVENNGELTKDAWRKSDDGTKQYYLGSDGYMLRSTLIDIDGGYYYVNSAGEMSTNCWKFIQNPAWQGDELVNEASWYYFQNNGRAYATRDGKTQVVDIGGKKYAFDSYGRMLTGWMNESGDRVAEEDWPSAVYYGDGEGDGSIVTKAWVYIAVPDDDNEDENEPVYHFYFGSNGKKTTGADKKIGDKKYTFDERGVAVYGWKEDGDEGWKYYGESEDPYLHTGWFQAVPHENMDSDAHNDGSEYYFHAATTGELDKNIVKTIDGKTYLFNGYGRMMTGLKLVTLAEDKKTVTGIKSIESLNDMPEGISDGTSGVCLFGGDGAAKLGTQTVDLEGTNYTFSFKSSGSPKGAGLTGFSDGYIYDNGRRLTAEEGSKYGVVEWYDDVKSENPQRVQYLLSESGSIQKSKKNIKDSDGYYYCTNNKGVLIHDPLSDKCDGKEGHDK